MTTRATPTEHWTESSDGTRLFYRRWQQDSPKAAVAIVHGYAEHSGRYDHVAAMLNELQLDVFALDERGHGRSDGVRGHVGDYAEYSQDVRALLNRMREESASDRFIILGHSNGGLITLNYAIDPDPAVFAIVVTAPFLGAAIEIPAWKALLGRVMAKIYPTLAMPSGLPTDGLSHDKAVVKAYEDDPLVFPTATAGFFVAATSVQEKVKNEASGIKLPCLVMQGMEDPLVDASQAKPLFESLGSADKHYIEYPGMFHEIMNETDKAKVLGDIRDWLSPRL